MSGSIRASTSRAARRDALIAAATPPLAQLPANRRAFWSLWIFLALFVCHALRRVRRQRQAARRPLPGRAATSRSSASTPKPTSAASSRPRPSTTPRGALPDPHGRAARPASTTPRASIARGRRPAPSTASRSRSRLDALAADPLQLQHHQLRRRHRALAARPRTTGSAPTTRPATCWRGSSTASASRCCSRWSSPSISSLIGIVAGACQGYFGGWVDLFFQRIVEIWGSTCRASTSSSSFRRSSR